MEAQLEAINVEKIQKLKVIVKKKKELIQQMRKTTCFTNEEKIQLLNKVIVNDYELEYFFTMPNYDHEFKSSRAFSKR